MDIVTWFFGCAHILLPKADIYFLSFGKQENSEPCSRQFHCPYLLACTVFSSHTSVCSHIWNHLSFEYCQHCIFFSMIQLIFPMQVPVVLASFSSATWTASGQFSSWVLLSSWAYRSLSTSTSTPRFQAMVRCTPAPDGYDKHMTETRATIPP